MFEASFEKVREYAGKKTASVIVWVANAVESIDWYRERRLELSKTMPQMILHQAECEDVDARSEKMATGSVDNAALTKLLEKLSIWSNDARKQIHDGRLRKCKQEAFAVLDSFDKIEAGEIPCDAETSATLEPLVKAVMAFTPDSSEVA